MPAITNGVEEGNQIGKFIVYYIALIIPNLKVSKDFSLSLLSLK